MSGDRPRPPWPVTVDEIEYPRRDAGLVDDFRKQIALSGAISLGFRTTVQPVASAGATLEAIWFSGQFHGVISPQTPIGSRRTIRGPSALRTGNVASTRAASSK